MFQVDRPLVIQEIMERIKFDSWILLIAFHDLLNSVEFGLPGKDVDWFDFLFSLLESSSHFLSLVVGKCLHLKGFS